jgi:pyridoxal phosphate enzyme (YggS family)
MSIAENIARIRRELPPQAALIAVSKTRSAAAIMEAYAAGQRDFGENRPQELLQKSRELPRDIRWHFIGHLQSNKVKMVAPVAHLIHSMDSTKLLRELNKTCASIGVEARCLLQVHVAREETKFGFSPSELLDFLRSSEAAMLRHVRLCGLMGMATNTANMEQVRGEFRLLRQLREQAQPLAPQPEVFVELSMGMSNDYLVAVSEGASWVRVGTGVFGSF